LNMDIQEVNDRLWTVKGEIIGKLQDLEIKGNPDFSDLMKLKVVKNLAPDMWPEMTNIIAAAENANGGGPDHFLAHNSLLDYLEKFNRRIS
jgi:hypothetical protein